VGAEPFGVAEAMTIMQGMSEDFRVTLEQMSALLINLNTVAGDTAFQRNVTGMARNADEISRITADLLRNNRVQLEQTLDRLSAAISSAEKLTTSAAGRVDTTFNAIDSAVTEVARLAASLRAVTERLNDGSSTMGKLLTDDELYTRLNTTLADVDSLVVSIKKNGLRNKIVLF
jgi:phospholipid/cholesterol/gamma-HCH transport system substrate-binding protein